MEAVIKNDFLSAVLTTEHRDSCFGVPVLVFEGTTGMAALGPADALPDGQLAADYVADWADVPERTEGERAFASSFISLFAHSIYTHCLR
jgi:hypothetical protein